MYVCMNEGGYYWSDTHSAEYIATTAMRRREGDVSVPEHQRGQGGETSKQSPGRQAKHPLAQEPKGFPFSVSG